VKLLIITESLSFPPKSGGDVAIFNMIRSLSSIHSINVIYLGKEASDDTNLKASIPSVTFIPIKDPKYGNVWNKSMNYLRWRVVKIKDIVNKLKYFKNIKTNSFSDINLFSDYYLFKKTVSKHLKNNSYDIIQVELPMMIGLIKHLKNKSIKVYVVSAIIYKMLEQEAQIHKHYELSEIANNVKIKELHMMLKYDGILTLSESDRDILAKEISHPNIIYSPPCIDIDHFKRKSQLDKVNKVVFLCNAGHYPNIDALNYFFHNIYPELNVNNFQIPICITGKHDKKFRSQFIGAKNVEWAGFVEDIRNILCGAISIAPIRIGTGIRVKLLESMLFGCPVVSTTIGISGIPHRSNYDCVVADDPKSFAKAIINLFKNTDFALRLGQNARSTIMDRFSNDRVKRIRENAYLKILKSDLERA